MTFSRKTLMLAAVVTLGALAVAQDAQAGCRGSRGGYGGGYRGGYGGGYVRHSSPSYNYAPSYNYSRPVQTVRTLPAPQPQQFEQPQQQFTPQQTIAPQQQFAQQPAGSPQQQQFAPQQAGSPQQQQFTPQQAAAPQQQFTQPQAAAPQQQTAPAPTQAGNAQMSALQALGGFAPPQAAPTQTAPVQNQTPSYVGTWTATLGNGSNVQMTLQADGNFSWSATNKAGNVSSFSGQFTVGNGSLTLIRANDSQKLEGSMSTSNQNAFSFKVAGNNAAAINFSRS